jgi:hypothetical protein
MIVVGYMRDSLAAGKVDLDLAALKALYYRSQVACGGTNRRGGYH